MQAGTRDAAGNQVSAKGRIYMSLIHELPCVVHWFCYGKFVSCDEAHHIEYDRDEHSDHATVPLCYACHVSMHHMHRRPFYLAHKLTDVKLLAWTNELREHHLRQQRAA